MQITREDFETEFKDFGTKAPFALSVSLACRSSLRVFPHLAAFGRLYSQKEKAEQCLTTLRCHISLLNYLMQPTLTARKVLENSTLQLHVSEKLGPVNDLSKTVQLIGAGEAPKPELSKIISGTTFLAKERFQAAQADKEFLERLEFSSTAEVITSIIKRPLWVETPRIIDSLLSELWSDSKSWAYWEAWYSALLHGDAIDQALQNRVCYLSESDWSFGPETVAKRINEVTEDLWAERLPQHEKLAVDNDTGKFRVYAKFFDDAEAVESWLKQIDFAVNLAVDTNTSDFNRMCTAFKYLSHTLESCRDDPNAIEQQVGIAWKIIDQNISREDYSTDDSLVALSKVLEQIQVQMRADHPEVRKAWEKRIAQRIRETDRETKLEAAKAIRAETERTEQRLSDEMELDAEAIETSDDAEVQAAALRRAGGRAAKMNALERASDTAKKIDASGGYKAVRIGSTGYTVGDIVWMLKDLFW